MLFIPPWYLLRIVGTVVSVQGAVIETSTDLLSPTMV